VVAWVLDMFFDFYFVKNHKIVNNSTTNRAGEKISAYLESLEFTKFFDVSLVKSENNQILRNKISHRFLIATKVYTEWKILIVTSTLANYIIFFTAA
jgi:hypothetical protein